MFTNQKFDSRAYPERKKGENNVVVGIDVFSGCNRCRDFRVCRTCWYSGMDRQGAVPGISGFICSFPNYRTKSECLIGQLTTDLRELRNHESDRRGNLLSAEILCSEITTSNRINRYMETADSSIGSKGASILKSQSHIKGLPGGPKLNNKSLYLAWNWSDTYPSSQGSGATGLYQRRNSGLETIAVAFLALWVFGMVSSYTFAGFIHILLVAAIVVVLIRSIKIRRPLNQAQIRQQVSLAPKGFRPRR